MVMKYTNSINKPQLLIIANKQKEQMKVLVYLLIVSISLGLLF
jgi:hypothetical protein